MSPYPTKSRIVRRDRGLMVDHAPRQQDHDVTDTCAASFHQTAVTATGAALIRRSSEADKPRQRAASGKIAYQVLAAPRHQPVEPQAAATPSPVWQSNTIQCVLVKGAAETFAFDSSPEETCTTPQIKTPTQTRELETTPNPAIPRSQLSQEQAAVIVKAC